MFRPMSDYTFDQFINVIIIESDCEIKRGKNVDTDNFTELPVKISKLVATPKRTFISGSGCELSRLIC